MITTRHTPSLKEFIDGPEGKIEILMHEPTGTRQTGFGIVCHPHPLYGGNMQNKVVTTLVKTLQHFNLTTVQFNFRGVGKSAGQYDHGSGELEDLIAVIDWVKSLDASQPIWLAGFSFGGFIAAAGAAQVGANKLITVAPAVEHFPMQYLPPITCDWVLVQGERDDVVSPQAVFDFAESRDPKPHILRFPEAGHFFHGALVELRERLIEALSGTM